MNVLPYPRGDRSLRDRANWSITFVKPLRNRFQKWVRAPELSLPLGEPQALIDAAVLPRLGRGRSHRRGAVGSDHIGTWDVRQAAREEQAQNTVEDRVHRAALRGGAISHHDQGRSRVGVVEHPRAIPEDAATVTEEPVALEDAEAVAERPLCEPSEAQALGLERGTEQGAGGQRCGP